MKPKPRKTKAQRIKEWKREKKRVPQWIKDEEQKAAQHLRDIARNW